MKIKTLLFLSFVGLFSVFSYSNIYTVTISDGNSTAPGSLRDAVQSAIANLGSDQIRFQLAGGTTINSWGGLDLGPSGSDITINGFSLVDGLPITFGFSVYSKATNNTFKGLNFVTSNNSIEISGGNNTIDSCSFFVSGWGQNAVWIKGGNNSIVTNSTFSGSQQHAVSIEVGGGHTIDNCSATNIKDVAFIARGTGGNVFSNCSASEGNHNGFGLLSKDNIIEDCTAYNNDRSGIAIDNSTGQGNGNIIRRNKVFGNNQVFYMGASKPLYDQSAIFSNGPNTEIYDNYVYDNAAHGVMIHGAFAAGAIVNDNTIGRDDLGNELGNGWNGVYIHGANGAIVADNVVVNNGYGASHNSYFMPESVSGIRIETVTSGTVQNNYVGTDANKINAGNAFDGITLYTNTIGVDITGNVSCNNGYYDFDNNTSHSGWNGSVGGGGIALRLGSGNNVSIVANYVGVHKDNSDGGNKDYGISIEGGNNVLIGGTNSSDGNIIGFSKNAAITGSERGCGVWLYGASSATLFNNQIISNVGNGIQIESTSTGNIIGANGDGNSITGNNLGILVSGNSAVNNTFRYNSFSCNINGGISLQNGGNTDYGNGSSPKGIVVRTDDIRPDFVSGYAPSANATIDLYVMDTNCPLNCTDNANQGITMVASVVADGTSSSNGLYAWEYDFVSGGNLVGKNTVIVLATEQGSPGNVNSSEFSICHLECDTPKNSLISSADFDICPGENTTLIANSFGMESAGYTYNWYLGSIAAANLVNTAIDDSTYTTGTDGDYYVVISHIGDPNACADTSTLGSIEAHDNPVINLTPSANSLCSNSSVSLDADATGSNLTFDWIPGNQNSAVINITTGGLYEVTVTNSLSGCQSTDDVSITEYDSPENVTINSNDFSLCPGETADLIANASGLSLGDGYTYTWYLNSIGVGNEVNTVTNDSLYSTGDAGDYIVVVSNNASSGVCSSSSGPISVTMNDNPIINFTSLSSGICTGEIVTIEANAIGANLEYIWTPGGEVNASIDVQAGGTYGLTVTNSVTGCNSIDQIDVVENTPPEISLTDITFCQDDSTKISAGISGMDYVWSPSGNTTESFYIDISGEHRVVVTDPITGCISKDTVEATQSSDPKPIVELTDDSLFLCPTEGDLVELIVNVISNVNGVLTWSDGTLDEFSIIADDSVQYKATYLDDFGCLGSDSVKIYGECIPPDPELPNIVSDESPWTPIGKITPEQVLEGTSNFIVYDRWGLMMFKSSDKLPEWKGNNTKDLPCSAGVYFWTWEFTDNTEEVRRYNGFVQLITQH